MTGLHRQGRVEPLKGLDAGHLIGARHMRARSSQRRGRLIHLADGADLLGQLGGVVGRWSKPVPLAMRLQSAQLLKTLHRAWRNLLDNAAFDRFVGQFARRPTAYRPIRRCWRFTRQRHDLHELLEGESRGRSGALLIGQEDFDGLTEQFRLSCGFDRL